MGRPIRWGIIGLGNIAAKFAADLALLPDGLLWAVASRDMVKARSFASEYNAQKAYGSYGALLEDPDVEVVYIATPHSLHKEHTLAALEAGKHVLCEKPLGISSSEVQQMVHAAEKNNRFLMEALWSRFNPSIREVHKMISTQSLGPLTYLSADFSFPALDRDPSGRLLNPALAGGSLLDIGIYPVFLAYLMLGNPDEIQVTAYFHDTGVEKQIGMLFTYPDAMAMLYSGFTARSHMKATLGCTGATVYLNPRWHEAESYEIERGDDIQLIEKPLEGTGYFYEIEEVHRCLGREATQSSLWTWSDSIQLHRILDRIRQQTGIVFPGDSLK